MPAEGGVRIQVRGGFSVTLASGVDVTPIGNKERALVALLAFSPDRRRTRAWLQDRLWSDRFEEQARISLRRCLSNVRAKLNIEGEVLVSDRRSVWIEGPVVLDFREGVAGLELLDDIDVADGEFRGWLEALRMQNGSRPLASSRARSGGGDAVFAIAIRDRDATPEGSYLSRHVADTLASRLASLGEADLLVTRGKGTDGDRLVQYEIETLAQHKHWFVHLRAVAGRSGTFLWSGHLHLPLDFERIVAGPDVAALVGHAVTAVVERCAALRTGPAVPYLRLQQAALRIFSGDERDLDTADRELAEIGGQGGAGVVQAWRSYVRLTQALEFGAPAPSVRTEAEGFGIEALAAAPSNPLVLGLVAQVQLKVLGDHDYGRHLAQRAMHGGEQHPYALHAMSQALQFAGDHQAAYVMAKWSRAAARSLANSYCWDLQACLAALGLHRLDEAQSLAREANIKMPRYRPALRYLYALSRIAGDTRATTYLDRLSMVEPGFQPIRMLEPNYPIETLRRVGLLEDLKNAIAANGVRAD